MRRKLIHLIHCLKIKKNIKSKMIAAGEAAWQCGGECC